MVRQATKAVASAQAGDFFVGRERLFARLDELRPRAVWLQAPTGAGKTVLLRQYARRGGQAMLWLQTDAASATADSFCATLIRAVQQAGGDLPQFAGERREVPQQWLVQAVARIAQQWPGALIALDDAHRLLPSLAPLLASMVDTAADRLRLLFAAQEPPSGLEVQIAAARLIVIGHEHLAFDKAEALELARRIGAAEELAAPLRERTSGWAAGLMLALQLAQGASPANVRRRVDPPLASFVRSGLLGGVPRPIVEALAALAPARQVPLAVADSGAPWDQAVAELERLERRGLFVERVDGDFRLHDLLRDALLQAPPADAQRDAAIEALTRSGRAELALACITALPELGDRLRGWLQDCGEELLRRGDIGALSAMVLKDGAALPPPVRLWCARGALATDLQLADRTAEQAYAESDEADTALRRRCCGIGLLAHSVLLDGRRLDTWRLRLADLPPASDEDMAQTPLLEAGARLVEHVLQPSRPNTPEIESIHALLHRALLGAQPPQEAILAASVLVYALLQLQRRHEIPAMLEQIESAEWFARAPVHTQIEWQANKGYTLRGLGRAEQAAASFATACDLARRHGLPALLRSSLSGQARALLTIGDLGGADAALKEAHAIAADPGLHSRIEELTLTAWLELALARPMRALSATETAYQLLGEQGVPPPATLHLDHAQVLFALGRTEAALALAEETAAGTEGAVRDMAECTWQLLRALALWSHDAAAAHEALHRAVALIEQRRWTNFLSLLPREAGVVAHRALQSGGPLQVIRDGIRERRLPAPAGAGAEWPWPLRVFVVGRLRLERFDDVVQFHGKVQRKPLEVLRYLACAREQVADQSTICAALWPDAEEDAARRSLEMAIARLREMLGSPVWIRVGDGKLRLDPAQVWCDAQALWRVCEAAELAGRRHDADGAKTAAEAMLMLYRGPLLDGEDESSWLLGARERLRAAFVRAARAVAESLQAQRQHDLAIALLEQALAAEPLAEELAQRLMIAYLEHGQPAEAMRTYRQLQRMLASLLGTPPSAATERLRQSIVGLPREGSTS
jgi:DNA-binding SARP family transcriptional activator